MKNVKSMLLTWAFGIFVIVASTMAFSYPIATWTVISVTGLMLAGWGFLIAYGNIVAVRVLKRNGPNELVARQGLRNESLRVLKHAIAIILALVVMFDRRQQVWVIGGLVVIQLVTVISTWLDRRDEHKLLLIVQKMEEDNATATGKKLEKHEE